MNNALQTLESIIAESSDCQQLIAAEDFQSLETLLDQRQKKLQQLFQDYPNLADNPVAAEKIRQLLQLDEDSLRLIRQQRNVSDQEFGDFKRNAEAIKHYIDVDSNA